MNLYSESIGHMRFKVFALPRGLSYYLTVEHSDAANVIGLRYLGCDPAHADRQFARARDNALAALAAEIGG